MFCEKCGTKNENGAQFCENCGAKMVGNNPKKKINIKEKISKIPKKVKIGIISILVIVIALVIVLSILLNNPVKKIEDNLASYYDNYTEEYTNEELVEIGKILKNKKGDDESLKSIKKQATKTIKNWVKNFNTSYKDTKALDKAYQKVTGVLRSINNYFDGLEYILDDETYNDYKNELETLYYSKKNYLTGLDYSEDNYQRYYYSQRVAENDSYYQEAQKIVANFIKESMDSLKKKVESLITVEDSSTDEEKYHNYSEVLKYIKDNKYQNNLDLSSAEDYKKIYKEYYQKMLESLKAYTKKLVDNGEVTDAVVIVTGAMDSVPYESDEYIELNKLKEEYNDMLPVTLTSMFKVADKGSIDTTRHSSMVDGEYYDGYIRHRFNGEGSEITYRTNKEYKRFRGSILIGKNWDKDYKVSIKIYGDDKEIYSLNDITKESTIDSKIDLDISNVDDIRIEFVTTSGEKSYYSSYRYIYIVEPYLYK